MKYYTLFLICCFLKSYLSAQNIQLTDHLKFPRLDSAYWMKDYDEMNANESSKANKFRTCTFIETDTTRSRFCFNTTAGHVQLDSGLHNITPEKLIGEWNLTHAGTFEVADSLANDAPTYDRKVAILQEYKSPSGSITFTHDKMRLDFKNIEHLSTEKASYYIAEGKYLVTKKLGITKSASTIIGITKENFLILDDHTYKTIAQKGKYLVIRTTIRRLILKKVE